MLDSFLVPEKTVVTAKGDGTAIDISGASHRVLLATLTISNIVEQESLDVSIWGSPDCANWGAKPVASFPQKFYKGEHPLLIDLRADAQANFLRAHWEVSRWGRGTETPMFEFHVTLKEVPPEVLEEASRQTRT